MLIFEIRKAFYKLFNSNNIKNIKNNPGFQNKIK